MTILIQTIGINGYSEGRLVEEITESIQLLGIDQDKAQVKVMDTDDTLIENAENAIAGITNLELDFHFSNEWDNDTEKQNFTENLVQWLEALNTLVNTFKID